MVRRRTQAERRAQTIGKIVDATIEAMHDVGYARTTIKEICERSGVSQGGLFRHFGTRLDVIVAAADEVASRHAAAFIDDLGHIEGDPLEAAVRAARARCHSPINAVWHELMIACRTDEALRDAVKPAAERHRSSIERLARGVLGAELPKSAEPLVWYVIHCFDGEAIDGTVLADPDGEELRIRWVVETLRRELSGV